MSGEPPIDNGPASVTAMAAELSNQGEEIKHLRMSVSDLREALSNLVDAVAADELMPESVSFMRNARSALIRNA